MKESKRNEIKSMGKETKSFYQFPEDIGISGDLKKLFFGRGLSGDTICLTNPIKKEDLHNARVGYINVNLKSTPQKPKKNKA